MPRPTLPSRTSNDERRARVAATVALLALTAAVTACGGSSGSSSAGHGRDSAVVGGSVGSQRGLEFVAPDSSGNFPAVSDPPSSGSLAQVKVRLNLVATLHAPTALVARPGHPNQLWVTERAGRILVANRSTDGSGKVTFASEPLLDWHDRVATDGEEGMLGLAFDPSGSKLYFTTNVEGGDTHLNVVSVTDTPSWPRLGTPKTVLTVDQPDTTNHKGGQVAFGPDGMLYLGLGDGGGQGDPNQRAQDPKQLLGKILRIDPSKPSADRAYGIPSDNPYASGGGAPEVWLTGLRNPWRFSFDSTGGDLWIGDVGQNEREEIDRLPFKFASGANLGWSGYEGTRVYEKGRVPARSIPPIYEELHSDGSCAITGGVVYRGKTIPALTGAYLLSDLCRPGIRALRVTSDADSPGDIGKVVDHAELAGADKAIQVISFGTDADGEVYLLSLDGDVYRLDPAA